MQRPVEPTRFPSTPFLMLLGLVQALRRNWAAAAESQVTVGQPGAELCFLAFLPVPLTADFCDSAGILTYHYIPA